MTTGGGGAGGLGGLCGGPVRPVRGRCGGTCGGIPLGFPFGAGGVPGWVAAGTGVACEDLEEPVRVWGKGSSFALLVGRDGVPWGLGVLG